MKVFNFFTRFLYTLTLLLTLTVGQMWANDASNARIYFDNTNTGWSYVQLVGGHNSWSSGTALSLISGTNNLWTNTWSWGGYTYFMFIEASGSWAGEGSEAWNRKGDLNYSATISDNVGSDTYLYAPTSSAKNTGYAPSGSISGYSALNYNQTIYQCVSENGAAAAKSTANIATVTITTKNLSDASTTQDNNGSISSGNNSVTKSAARTATVTMSVTSIDGNYAWLGWYDSESGGSQIEASQTYTYTATEAKTVYARFSHETSHTVAVTYKCTETNANVKSAENPAVGEVTPSTFTAGTPAGFSFTSWTVGDGLTITSGSTSTNSISIKTKSSGTYTLRANYSEVLTTDWKLIGDNQSGSPFGDNYTYASGKAMSKKSGYSTASDAYKTIDVTKLPANYYGFKVATAAGSSTSWGYGESEGYYITFNRSASGTQQQVYSGDQHELKFVPDALGEYEFRVNYPSNKYVYVTFPTAYTVTFSKGSVVGSDGDISATYSSVAFASGTKVQSGKSVTLTAPAAKSGYSWKGWYTNAAGTTGKIDDTDRAISVTMNADKTLYACYTENLTAITITTDGHGTITTPSPNNSPYNLGVATTQAINASPSTGYSWSTWTTSGTAVLGTTATTASNTAKGNGTNGSTGTITATFSPNHYDVILDVNGGSGDNQTVDATFDAAMPTTVKTAGTAIAARTKTGYNFDGYWANSNGTGTQYYTAALASNHVWDVATNNTHIYAKWNAKQSAITFDYQTGVTGYSSSGNITNASGLKGTYDAAMTALTGTMPRASNGYAFMGFYDAVSGGGTKYYNADGTSAHTWDKDTEAGTTLYAYWTNAEITTLTLDAAVVEPEDEVGVTPTVSPTPTGTTIICWEVRYADTDNPLDPQPSMTWSEGKMTFDAPAVSGLYKIVATLKTGSNCAGGTTLSTNNINVQVAGSHTVTIAYKHSGTTIAASTSITGRPLAWSDDITAPDIFGYQFDHWTAEDGITITDDDGETSETSSSSATIKIKATYDGTLTANYTPKSLIYFKNTLGWTSVYVNFYKSDYWNDSKGSGNNGVPVQNKTMTQLGETDIWYYDYGSDDFTGYTNTKPTNYVSFTNESRSSAENFWGSGTGILVSYPARRADDLADKSGETGFYESTPMFVPLAGQAAITKNEGGGGKALYYNSGYWTKYLPGTGYSLEFYDNGTGDFIKSMDFTSADELMPMKAVADLEAGTTYKFQIKRHADVYLGNSGTMTYSNHGQSTPWEMTNSDFAMCGLTTTASGDYTFNFTYSANASNEYRMRLSVDYPVSDGDYRLVYTDNTRSGRIKPSAIVQKENDGSAIVSFFVRHNQTPVLRIQQASVDGSGNITWNEYPTSGTPTNQITGTIASAITKDTVYNFNLSMNGSGALSVAGVEYYSGNYYIRTDAANSKWDNYRTDPDHLMTYSEYSITHGGYSHYYTHWVNKDDVGRKNVKFVIANDYSPCISDTLAREAASGTWANIATFMEEGGDLKRSANVRYMWDIATNAVSRAYIDGAQESGTHFLEILSDDEKIQNAAGTETLTAVTFSDNGNWIYEANVKAQPNAQIKLKSTWGEGTTIEQYFKGASDKTEALVGGSGDTWYDIRVIYDFKTNRLVASYVPATGTISSAIEINADVMFIREHQGDIAQLTFSGSGAISKITTAYGVMRFNKWTINNKDKSTHSPLSPELSRFERDLFYISFPFRVNLEEVFGFGTYGTHWIIEYYDGAARAANGFWADTPSYWRFITNRKGKFLEPNEGYILALDLDELGETSSVWANTEQVELYFPSYGTMPTITSSTVTYNIPEHTCSIGPRFAGGDDRRIKDSHWNVLPVPTYINTDDLAFANTTWIAAGDGQLGPNFLYTWNMNDNTLSATSGVGYEYKAMHAYMVQYCGNVTWTTSVSPALAPRRNPSAPNDTEFRVELRQNEQKTDQTFVRLSNDEHVTTGFEFNYDLSKEFNKNKSNIYTIITSTIDGDLSLTEAAGNCLPLTEQTTVVPVGVQIATEGDYTFAIPDGTNGIGVTLVDNETGIRTSLSALTYTVNLTAGKHDGRFVLEISPIQQSPTAIENVEVSDQDSDVRKVLIDNQLFIIKGDKMFDARGAMVK